MQIKFIDKFTDPEQIGIHGQLLKMPSRSLQASYKTVLFNFTIYMMVYFMIRSLFEDKIGCFLWYVFLPVFLNVLSIFLNNVWTDRTDGRDNAFYASYRYIITGVILNFFIYSNVVFIYRCIPHVWIINFIPVLLACYFRSRRWFALQSLLQGIFIVVMLMIRNVKLPYDFSDVPPLLQGLFFAINILLFSQALLGQDNLKRRAYANTSTYNARMEAQRVYGENLSDYCRPYLNRIDTCAAAIKNDTNDEEVLRYVWGLTKANEELKEAIGEGQI